MKKIYKILIIILFIITLSSCNNELEETTTITTVYKDLDTIDINCKAANLYINKKDDLEDNTYSVTLTKSCDITYKDNILKIESNKTLFNINILYNAKTKLNALNFTALNGSCQANNVQINNFMIDSKNCNYSRINALNITSLKLVVGTFYSFGITNSKIEKSDISIEETKYGTFIKNNSINELVFKQYTNYTKIEDNKLNNAKIITEKANINFHKNSYADATLETNVGTIFSSISWSGGYTIDISSPKKEIYPEYFTIQDNKYIYGDGSSHLNVKSNFKVCLWFY